MDHTRIAQDGSWPTLIKTGDQMADAIDALMEAGILSPCDSLDCDCPSCRAIIATTIWWAMRYEKETPASESVVLSGVN